MIGKSISENLNSRTRDNIIKSLEIKWTEIISSFVSILWIVR